MNIALQKDFRVLEEDREDHAKKKKNSLTTGTPG
jgi:hypothetical protein